MLWSGFILGLLGSLHCIGMCGPIAFMLPVDRKNSIKKASQITLYHIGRLFAYSLLGFVFGLLGASISIFGQQQKLSIAVGVIIILVVITPINLFKKFNITTPLYGIISKLKSKLGQQFKKKTPETFFIIGFLNGFLPCGLVYMAVFAAIATANSIYSSLYMILFGLGTIPLMTTTVYLGKFLNTTLKQRIQKAIPIFVICIGILFVIRGLGLGIPYLSPSELTSVKEVSAEQSCH